MSLLFVEGFDNVTVGTLSAKGWSFPGGAAPTAMGTGRTGANAVTFTASSGNSHEIQKALGSGEHATVIAGMAIKRTSATQHDLIQFRSDSAATLHLQIIVDTTGAIVVKRGDGTTLGTSTAVVLSATWGYLEVAATLHDSTGAVTIAYNGTSILSLTGVDTKNGGTKTVFDAIRFGTGSASSSSDLLGDDIYVCNGAGSANNAMLGDSKVQTIVPDGNGNASQMVGSDGNSVNNYQLVNAAAPQTTNYVGSPTTDNEDTYSHGDVTGAAVYGVQLCAYAAKTDAGSRTLALITRTGATDYASSDLALPNGSQSMAMQVRETNPNTSAAWTVAGVNGAEFGVRARP